ncbi:hypothetical protein BpHYR1_018646 [Brachionus plicatilis]|uniref:Uncharacterized protein n=1 Tax=Brachionus plicatilis TaxID=10195 RepID=A0A3M7PUL3_BRAPC|nr:hypothetical protein BpHYR1_018646 [Brachionus plicatilis]
MFNHVNQKLIKRINRLYFVYLKMFILYPSIHYKLKRVNNGEDIFFRLEKSSTDKLIQEGKKKFWRTRFCSLIVLDNCIQILHLLFGRFKEMSKNIHIRFTEIYKHAIKTLNFPSMSI